MVEKFSQQDEDFPIYVRIPLLNIEDEIKQTCKFDDETNKKQKVKKTKRNKGRLLKCKSQFSSLR